MTSGDPAPVERFSGNDDFLINFIINTKIDVPIYIMVYQIQMMLCCPKEVEVEVRENLDKLYALSCICM